LYGYMFTHPGGKLLFMGCEFAQTTEWNFKKELPWELLQFDSHKGMQKLVKDLNKLYTTSKAMYEYQFEDKGFEWVDLSNHEACIISYLRKCDDVDESLLVVCNFDTVGHRKIRFGVPQKGKWETILNTDDEQYWGSGFSLEKSYEAENKSCHGKVFSIEIEVPPMSVIVLKNS
jgi:1,4-alpha-glucan branching enzyme